MAVKVINKKNSRIKFLHRKFFSTPALHRLLGNSHHFDYASSV